MIVLGYRKVGKRRVGSHRGRGEPTSETEVVMLEITVLLVGSCIIGIALAWWMGA
jgi:hypothetical protein